MMHRLTLHCLDRRCGAILSCVLGLLASLIADASSAGTPAQKAAPTKLYGRVDEFQYACAAAGVRLSAEQPPCKIQEIRVGSAAALAGLQVSDQVLSASVGEKNLELMITRNGQRVAIELPTAPTFLGNGITKFGDRELSLLRQAEGFMKANRLDEAERCLDSVASTSPSYGPTFLDLSAIQAKRGDQTTQLAYLVIAKYLAATTPEDTVRIRTLEEELMSEIARKHYKFHRSISAKASGTNQVYLLNLGARLYSIGHIKAARVLFTEVARLDPRCADAYYNLGALCESLGLFDEAQNYYEIALKLSPTDEQFKNAVATVGRVPVLYQGQAISSRFLGSVKTIPLCDLCRIARGGVLTGD